jgi:carboxylate-amine ligase
LKKQVILPLFEGYGIELEYMIVDKSTLNILPISDELLRKAAGKYANEFNAGAFGWSNEFVLHVLELKNNIPTSDFEILLNGFNDQVTIISHMLEPMGGQLMPSGMHPWMEPLKETKLWNHRNKNIYETYHRIFDCKRHGWANIQSVQINISFDGDEEFGSLHTAIRLLLPLIPALAASSPLAEGKLTGINDTRLSFYKVTQRKIPSIMGRIIPEAVYSKAQYMHQVLGKMYRDVSTHDPKGILRHEWLNSRGAIPRFKRNAMEIRIADMQECPLADLSISWAIAEVLKLLVRELWMSYEEQKLWNMKHLRSIFEKTVKFGEEAVIESPRYLKVFGIKEKRAKAYEIWHYLIREVFKMNKDGTHAEFHKALKVIMEKGTLSKRITKSLAKSPSHKSIHAVYSKLCECLATGNMFVE